jgi:hypothetical protein
MTEAGSPSIQSPDYWWYRARAHLLETVLSEHVGEPRRLLDVGSADGPSVSWLRGHGKQVALDVDPRGIEHCEPEDQALAEVLRVLSPGGRFLMSVPAYQWAWTCFDDHNHHFRRYTRSRATRALRASGFEIMRATYIFGSTFPMFAADRLRNRLKERGRNGTALDPEAVPKLPDVSPAAEKALLGLADLDRKVLRSRNLPFGSSVVVAARKPY